MTVQQPSIFVTFDIFRCRPGQRTKITLATLELLATAEDQVSDTDCQTWQQPVITLSRRHRSAWRQEQKQKILLEKLYSFLAQHIQRYHSSLWT